MPDNSNRLIFSHKPQINISYPSNKRMWLVCLCAFLCVLQSALNDGGKSLIIAGTALFTALGIEFLLTWKNYRFSKIMDGSAAATAMILCLLMPNQLNPVYVFFGTAFAITVVKFSFGGLGSNWLNPALGGWLLVRFSWPSAYTNALGGFHDSIMEMSASANLTALDNNVTEFLNISIFSFLKVQLPSGYIDLLFNKNPGIIADRGLFYLLIGTIVITATGINRGWIPLVFLSVYGFLVSFAGDITGGLWNGDLLYGLFSGGTIAAAFILAAEPASSAKLRSGVFLTVILGAVFSWFFRYRCMEFSGCFIALALINCITPLVKMIEEKIFLSISNRGKFKENIL